MVIMLSAGAAARRGRRAHAGRHRLAGGRARGARQGRPRRPAAAARRRRAGDRRLSPRGRPASCRREVFLTGPGAVRAGRGAARSPRRCAARAGGPGSRGGLSPAAPHGGLRDGLRRRPARAGRPGAAAPQPADHGALRPGRISTGCGCWPRRGPGGAAMSALSGHVADYLAAAPGAGVQARARGHSCSRSSSATWRPRRADGHSELAIAWARLPERRQPQALGATPGHRPRLRRAT